MKRIMLCLLLLLTSCTVEPEPEEVVQKDIRIDFKAQFGSEAFACDRSYPNIGRGKQMYTPSDARVYIHDIKLLSASGKKVDLMLKDGTVFQSQGVVLLDFEDGANNCDNGTLLTNSVALGQAPDDQYLGVEFKIGLPERLNHQNHVMAPSPLNITGLWWTWMDGYKFMKVDGSTETMFIGALFHLGSTKCSGADGQSTCQNKNTPTIQVNGWEEGNAVIFDLEKLFEDAHLDMDEGEDLGCTSGLQDPDCAPIFRNLGLDFAGQPGQTQRVFRAE